MIAPQNKVIIAKVMMWLSLLLLAIELFFHIIPHFLPLIFENVNDVSPNYSVEHYGTLGDTFGVFNAFFSALAFGGLVVTLYLQIKEAKKNDLINRFYKMLDFQQNLVNNISVNPITKDGRVKYPKPINGRKAFVEYKIQLKYLMKTVVEVSEEGGFNFSEVDIADIAYAVFYYGSSSTWKYFMVEYLRDYEDNERLVDLLIQKVDANKRFALNRTNQNYLSVYFRNMYNTIKLIDSSDILSENEKTTYVKILRAQMCNAELYVLFFNLLSRFGRKWIENSYVERYELIQNLPSRYCDGYNPKDYFPKIAFEGEERCLSSFH